jgi:hypothetical protein
MYEFVGSSNKDCQSIYWVTAVRGPSDDRRIHIRTVAVKNQLAMKTDGSRIHLALMERKMPDGLYYILKRRKGRVELVYEPDIPIEKNWPDIKKVFPAHRNYELNPFKFNYPGSDAIAIDRNYIYLTHYGTDSCEDEFIRYSYFEDLWCIDAHFTILDYVDQEPMKKKDVFYFWDRGNDRLAAIMKFRSI